MSWQRDAEVHTTEWVIFTKDLGKNTTAFLEEVTRNPSYPANWRLSIYEGKVIVEQWAFKLGVTEHKSLKQATEKADELLASRGKEPELPMRKAEEPTSLPEGYGEGAGEWVWKESRPEWVPAGAKPIVVKETLKAVKSKADHKPAPFVDPLVDVGKLRNRQLETQRVMTRA